MHEGFDITFREVVPESSIIELVIEQMALLEGVDDLHCSVVLRRSEAHRDEFDAHVQLASPERFPRLHVQAHAPREHARAPKQDALHGEAHGQDPHEAVFRAFADLRAQHTMH